MPSDVPSREKPLLPYWNSKKNVATKRAIRTLTTAALVVCGLLLVLNNSFSSKPSLEFNYVPKPIRPERYPAETVIPLPRKSAKKMPKIQHKAVPETIREKKIREGRLEEIRNAFLHTWEGYKAHAWAQDELRPLAGGFKQPFCGWAATMVDSLDTLWIMGLKEEFELALTELENVDFTNKKGCVINLFETTIRHLGGLLAAWDLTEGKYGILMEKAVELAEVLFTAFDTPNRMPTPHYLWSATDPEATNHLPSNSVVLAVLGTLSLEFTRLSQITGDDKYYDGIQKVMDELEKWQDQTLLPGMWPAIVKSDIYNESIFLGVPMGGEQQFTLGALADSAYEYLPKQYMLLGGQLKSYQTMYEKFVQVAKKYLFFRPMTIGDEDILISGSVFKAPGGQPRLSPDLQHLSCFTGGMLAIAGKIFDRPEDVVDGGKLADGCVWAYRNTLTGIMPETLTAVPCANTSSCTWDSNKWYEAVQRGRGHATSIEGKIDTGDLSPGFAKVGDARYLLRPEAIESVFIMHRITANPYWRESGWNMFKSINAYTVTDIAHSAIENVLKGAPAQVDEMESFWTAETLKYFYLLFSENDVVSLDDYVLNTEAHPLRRPS
ncbi:hypothetical protein LZ554_008722 [Drepanopeziza brunnea f. sp. 'monogermtubi']|nr:hypothetical protein LZ554_008722 [Drepanopeziza brunnea f. sp. 'monogermtubi']